MKAAILVLVMSAVLFIISCGQDSPQRQGDAFGTLVSYPQSADDGSEGPSNNESEEVDEPTENSVASAGSGTINIGAYGLNNTYVPAKVPTTTYEVEFNSEEEGEDGEGSQVTLFDLSFVKLFGNNVSLGSFSQLIQEPPEAAPPEPSFMVQSGDAAWLIAYELTGGIFRFAKAKGEGELEILEDAGPVENYNGDMVDCQKLTKVSSQMIGLDHKRDEYSTGNLDVSMEICMRKNDQVSELLSPISFSIDADDFKYFDPCLGEVVLNGHSECIGIFVNFKKDPYVNFTGTYFCSTDSVRYKVNGVSYDVEAPVKAAHLTKNISGKLLTDLSTYSFSGDIQAGQKYTNFGIKQPVPAKVAACLND